MNYFLSFVKREQKVEQGSWLDPTAVWVGWKHWSYLLARLALTHIQTAVRPLLFYWKFS